MEIFKAENTQKIRCCVIQKRCSFYLKTGALNMKKLSLLLALSFTVLCFFGCGKQEEPVDKKPVIYLYPQQEEAVNVQIDYDGELTCTYPEYQSGWNVTAFPGGELIDERGQSYNYLYWEGRGDIEYDFTQGFCIPGKDTADFLERALREQGLNSREINEFIVYWLPQMHDNPYNLISFQGENYTDHARLNITPAPDSVIRVFMAVKPVKEKTDILPQSFAKPDRSGFTVVEWGGSMVEK